MKRIIALLLVSFFLVSADFVRFSPNSPSDVQSKIKATFIYNFTKYIEWPDEYKKGNFVIGVLGDDAFFSDMSTFFSSKTLGAQKYEVKLFSKPADILKCQVLFIPTTYSGNLNEALSKVKGKSTLVITDKPGQAKQGAAINFVSIDNKQKFELNKSNLEKYNLKVSNSLVNLAIVVE